MIGHENAIVARKLNDLKDKRALPLD